MAELEIHHHGDEHEADPTGKKVGVQAAILAVLLAIVTISSHRTHTSAIIHKSTSNDQWAYYQATRIKLHNTELGQKPDSDLRDEERWSREDSRRLREAEDEVRRTEQRESEKARGEDEAAEADEHRALRFDIGEGLLEIGLVLSSLYFIARKNMFR